MLCHEIARRISSVQERVDAAWECPISRESIRDAVLASDGRVYEREALTSWLERCRERHEPYSSPITREALRPCAARLADSDEAILLGVQGSGGGATPDLDLVPEQSDPSSVALRRSGSAHCRHWNTQLGVVTRMTVGWNDDDTVEWWFPVDSGGKIFTPHTALPHSLCPLADELTSWLGIRELIPSGARSSMHIFTAHFRVRSDSTFRTMEHRLLAS